LEVLKEKSQDEKVKEECARLLQMWEDSSIVF
jgi:hypothetical protein